jgi:pepF/M3 family oligoendopeptidase
MTETTKALPHWDMTTVYPSLESPEFAAAFSAAIQRIAALEELFAAQDVKQRASNSVDASLVHAFELVTNEFNAVLDDVRTLGAYISSFIATNSRNALAQARMSELQGHTMRLSQLSTRWTAWIGSLDVAALIAQSPLAADHAFALEQASTQAKHLMSPAEEALATELSLSSGTAWSKLHGNFTSQMLVSVEGAGTTQPLPMSVVRNLAYDPDREVRRRAYEAELSAWQAATTPLAAALNSIKGEVNTLSRHRGWPSPLAEALFQNNIDQQTLDAMMTAARESFVDFRRYLRAKARALGLESLAWYDIFAPVGQSTAVWDYDQAAEFIVAQFATYSDRLSDYAARSFAENWIDAEPRPGKRDGAFCMGVRNDESRILTNYKPAFGGMSTLAHELGHGYHNFNLAQRTPLQRSTPMTMAETASIFCETIIRQAALKDADPQEQIAILDASLQGACQVVVDISSRFLFEQRVFETRQGRELSVDEFSSFMLDAQRETYGDGLDDTALHPLMWAVKGHYYSSGRSFYNYPYMFGLLFGLGLYARYQREPAAFRASYDELLSATGMADAASLAARFGIDIRTPEFWRASFDIIRQDIDQFESLIQAGA